MSASFPGAPRRTRATGAFERRVDRALARHASVSEPLLVACSGGPDSSAALVAVARSGWPVRAAHFDHRLRSAEESGADRAAVERLADGLGVPLLAGAARRARGPASEQRAREARYRWLARACVEVGAKWCVTGHTLDDQAETVLLRLARGAGLAGVAGMAERAPWPLRRARGAAQLAVLRPLLDVTRAEVERYVAAIGIEALHDPSNEQLGYARNRVRRRVLPELERVHVGAARSLARFAELARRDEEALESLAASELARIASSRGQAASRGARRRGTMSLDRRRLAALPPAIEARVLRGAARAVGLEPDARQLEALSRAARRRGAHVDLGGGQACSDAAALHIERDQPTRR